MDDYYRDLIERTLAENHSINWHILFELMKVKCMGMKRILLKTGNEQSPKEKKYIDCLQNRRSLEKYSVLSLSQIFCRDLLRHMQCIMMRTELKKAEVVKLFNKFMSSFTEFFENRKNVFSKENISTSLCHRIVNDNALIFLNNMDSYKRIMENFKSESELVSKGTRNYAR